MPTASASMRQPTLDDLEDWLACRAPVTQGNGSESEALATRVALKVVMNCAAKYEFGKRAFKETWNPRCDPPWSDYDLDRFYSVADQEALRLRLRARRAKGTAASQARQEQVDLNRKLADALGGRSSRYVRLLRHEGTTQQSVADIMSKVLGGEPSDYLKRAVKRGRRTDLVGWFMAVGIDGCGFGDFLSDPPDDVEEDARTLISVLQTNGASDFDSLEALVAYVRSLNVPIDAADTVWREFKLWRIDAIAAIARWVASEGSELI